MGTRIFQKGICEYNKGGNNQQLIMRAVISAAFCLKMFDMSFFHQSENKSQYLQILCEGWRFPDGGASLRWIVLQSVYNTSKQKPPLCYSIHLRMDTITLKIAWHESSALFHPYITVQ